MTVHPTPADPEENLTLEEVAATLAEVAVEVTKLAEEVAAMAESVGAMIGELSARSLRAEEATGKLMTRLDRVERSIHDIEGVAHDAG